MPRTKRWPTACTLKSGTSPSNSSHDADVRDVRHAGQVWARVRRAWVTAGEPDTFEQFADTALEQLATAGVARMA